MISSISHQLQRYRRLVAITLLTVFMFVVLWTTTGIPAYLGSHLLNHSTNIGLSAGVHTQYVSFQPSHTRGDQRSRQRLIEFEQMLRHHKQEVQRQGKQTRKEIDELYNEVLLELKSPEE